MKLNRIAMIAASSLAICSSALAGPTMTTKEVAPPPPPPEPEPWIEGALTAAYESKYIFRGQDLGDNLFWVDLSATLFGFWTVGAWYANIEDPDFDELDLYTSFAYDIETGAGTFTPEIGFIAYLFPDSNADTTYELYGALSYSPIDLLSLGLYAGYDFEVEGWYFAATVEASIPVTPWLSLDPSAGISVNYDYFADPGDDDGAFNSVDVRLTANITPPFFKFENVTISPFIAATFPLEALDDQFDDEIYGGCAVSVSF